MDDIITCWLFMLPCTCLGCQDDADPASPLKSAGMLSEQSLQSQILYNTFKKGPRLSMLMIAACLSISICCMCASGLCET